MYKTAGHFCGQILNAAGKGGGTVQVMIEYPRMEESPQMNLHVSEVILANQLAHQHRRNPG